MSDNISMISRSSEFMDPAMPSLDRVRMARGGLDPLPSTRLGKLQPELSRIAAQADGLMRAFSDLELDRPYAYGDNAQVTLREIWSGTTIGGSAGQRLGKEAVVWFGDEDRTQLQVEKGTYILRADGYKTRVDLIVKTKRPLESGSVQQATIVSTRDASYGQLTDGEPNPDYKNIRLKVVTRSPDGKLVVNSGSTNRYRSAERYLGELGDDISLLSGISESN